MRELITTAIIIGAAVGAIAGVSTAQSKGYEFLSWQTLGYGLGGAIVGGASAWAGGAVGGAFLSENVIAAGFMGGATGGAANGFGNSILEKGFTGDAFVDAVYGGASGAIGGAACAASNFALPRLGASFVGGAAAGYTAGRLNRQSNTDALVTGCMAGGLAVGADLVEGRVRHNRKTGIAELDHESVRRALDEDKFSLTEEGHWLNKDKGLAGNPWKGDRDPKTGRPMVRPSDPTGHVVTAEVHTQPGGNHAPSREDYRVLGKYQGNRVHSGNGYVVSDNVIYQYNSKGILNTLNANDYLMLYNFNLHYMGY